MGPLCGLSLRGSSSCPAPSWTELIVRTVNVSTADRCVLSSHGRTDATRQSRRVGGVNSFSRFYSSVYHAFGVIFIYIINENKKAELSQRWPRDAPYVWVPWNYLGVPDYALGYFSQNFWWAFVPIEPINVHAKFEVRSFTRSRDNRAYPEKLGSPWIRPRSLFSKIFNGLLFGWTF